MYVIPIYLRTKTSSTRLEGISITASYTYVRAFTCLHVHYACLNKFLLPTTEVSAPMKTRKNAIEREQL